MPLPPEMYPDPPGKLAYEVFCQRASQIDVLRSYPAWDALTLDSQDWWNRAVSNIAVRVDVGPVKDGSKFMLPPQKA